MVNGQAGFSAASGPHLPEGSVPVWLLLRLASRGAATARTRLSSLSGAKGGRTKTHFPSVTSAVHPTDRMRSPAREESTVQLGGPAARHPFVRCGLAARYALSIVSRVPSGACPSHPSSSSDGRGRTSEHGALTETRPAGRRAQGPGCHTVSDAPGLARRRTGRSLGGRNPEEQPLP